MSITSNEKILREIEKHNYEGIRDQDGWETLMLTVDNNHSPVIAQLILNELK